MSVLAFALHKSQESGEHWITIHPHGKGANANGEEMPGRHVLIDGDGRIVGGAVPQSAQGKHITSWWKKDQGHDEPALSRHLREHGRAHSLTPMATMVLDANRHPTPQPSHRILIGEGHQTHEVKNFRSRGTHDETAPGHLRIVRGNQPGTYLLDSAYADKDALKADGAKWDPQAKMWVAPNQDVLHRVLADDQHFPHVTIHEAAVHAYGPQGPAEASAPAQEPSSKPALPDGHALPALQGTPKQVAWAEELRSQHMADIREVADRVLKGKMKDGLSPEQQAQAQQNLHLTQKWLAQHERQTSARWWIDHREAPDGYWWRDLKRFVSAVPPLAQLDALQQQMDTELSQHPNGRRRAQQWLNAVRDGHLYNLDAFKGSSFAPRTIDVELPVPNSAGFTTMAVPVTDAVAKTAEAVRRAEIPGVSRQWVEALSAFIRAHHLAVKPPDLRIQKAVGRGTILAFPVTKGYLTTAYGEGRAPSKTPDAGKRVHQQAAITGETTEESLPTLCLNGFTPNVAWALLRRAGYRLRITDGAAMLPGQTTIHVSSEGVITLRGAKAARYAAWFNAQLKDMVDWAGQIDGKQEVTSIRGHGGAFS